MEIIIKLLCAVAGFLIGFTIMGIFATARRKGLEDRIDVMKITSGKQDDAIRRKQNRVDELEREIRKERRKRGRGNEKM